MLLSEEFDFRFALVGPDQCNPPSGLEEPIVFERQFDSYGTVQTLGFRDSSDRNEDVFRLSDEATPVSRA
jgi:hypothetical protein